jgi:nicotinamide-nucleotide amidase
MPDDTTLVISPALKERAQSILHALKASQLSIVTAESCTGGMIAAILSRVDGAGDLLHGGFVTYTKEQKTKALGVSAQLLKDHGAVNETVVRQLATGALARSPR